MLKRAEGFGSTLYDTDSKRCTFHSSLDCSVKCPFIFNQSKCINELHLQQHPWGGKAMWENKLIHWRTQSAAGVTQQVRHIVKNERFFRQTKHFLQQSISNRSPDYRNDFFFLFFFFKSNYRTLWNNYELLRGSHHKISPQELSIYLLWRCLTFAKNMQSLSLHKELNME